MGFRYRAIPTVVDGILYASRLEATVGQLLSDHRIEFEAHVQFDVISPEGIWFSYTVDFRFTKPHRFLGVHKYITVLEVSGVLTRKRMQRMAALEYTHGIKGYTATPSLVEMWQNEGMF